MPKVSTTLEENSAILAELEKVDLEIEKLTASLLKTGQLESKAESIRQEIEFSTAKLMLEISIPNGVYSSIVNVTEAQNKVLQLGQELSDRYRLQLQEISQEKEQLGDLIIRKSQYRAALLLQLENQNVAAENVSLDPQVPQTKLVEPDQNQANNPLLDAKPNLLVKHRPIGKREMSDLSGDPSFLKAKRSSRPN